MDLQPREAAGQLEASPRVPLVAANSSYLRKLIWLLDIHWGCWSPQQAAARTNSAFPWSSSWDIRNTGNPLQLCYSVDQAGGSTSPSKNQRSARLQWSPAFLAWENSGAIPSPSRQRTHFQSATAKKELHSERNSCIVYRLLLFTNILRCNLSLFFFFCFRFSVFVWVGVCTWEEAEWLRKSRLVAARSWWQKIKSAKWNLKTLINNLTMTSH